MQIARSGARVTVLFLLVTTGCASSTSVLTPGTSTACSTVPAGSQVLITGSALGACEAQYLNAGAVLVAFDSNIAWFSAGGQTVSPDTGQDEGATAPFDPGISFDPTTATPSIANPDGASYQSAGSVPDAHTVAAIFTEPGTGIPHTFAADSSSTSELQQDVNTWLAAEASGGTVASSSSRRITDVTAPTYTNIAWTKIGEHSFYRKLATYCCNSLLPGMGSYGVVTTVYRLNTSDTSFDYVLVATQFSQNPNFSGNFIKTANNTGYIGWLNQYNNLQMSISDGQGISKGTLSDYAPQNQIKVTSTTVTVGQNSTYSVSANLSEKGGSIGGNYSQTNSASYSTTITQEAVTTTATGTLGGPQASWTDQMDTTSTSIPAPPTTIGTFNSARLAIFALPRAIYGVKAPAVTVGFGIKPIYLAYVFYDFTHNLGNYLSADFISGDQFTFALPVFSLATTNVTLKIGSTVTIPVTAQPQGGYAITWGIGTLPVGVTANVDSKVGVTGNFKLILAANAGAQPGTYFVYVNSIPPGAADSLRNGSIPVQVTITQ
jgi:hypothetical protein